MEKLCKSGAFAVFMLMMTLSCSKIQFTSDIPEEDPVSFHTYAMEFNGAVNGYENADTKAQGSLWKNGDVIYLTFYKNQTEKANVNGIATYVDSTGWKLTCEGNLPTGTGIRCDALFFDNPTYRTSEVVHLNPHTAIYETNEGTYDFVNNKLSVTALLKPKTGRIKFTGTKSQKVSVIGITSYSIFAPANGYFSTTTTTVSDTVDSSGSTGYIYGFFPDTTRRMAVIGPDYAFTRYCSEDVLKTGDSGYMAIPTQTSHNDWKSGLYLRAYGVDFKMILVSGLSSGNFFIGETEVTNELYEKVYYSNSSRSVTSPQKPKSYMSYSSIISWISNLNTATGLTFSLPTSSQWLYAAKGGSKSHNFTYSGSNSPGDVAWYSANASSSHDVKTKAPNELGIYDMSGNLEEVVLNSSSSSYTYYYYGGSYYDAASKITATSYKSGNSSYYDYFTGFRLCLNMQ